MKRYGNLFPEVIEFSNLLSASRQAQKGKRFRDSVLQFNFNLENELFQLQSELATKIYTPGAYTSFYIQDPKPRFISAAPYRDRVVHHALCNIISPIFERTFTRDSFANRIGFGTHRALHRFTKFTRTSRYILQCDIRKYFPSIDHEILKSLVRRKIKCRDTLWLIDTIIDASNEQEASIYHFSGDTLLTPLQRRRGLPIGNLTSQMFANVYLNGLDHFIKEDLHIQKYVRYMDDFSLFDDDVSTLIDARAAIEDYLSNLRLKLHPIKTQLFKTCNGANFVGFHVLQDRIRVKASGLHRNRRRLRRMQAAYKNRQIQVSQITQSLRSWGAHIEHADTWRLRKRIFNDLVFTRS